MARYRKKSAIIEAIQFKGNKGNLDEIENFVGGDAEGRGDILVVATLKGPLFVSLDDWIIKDVKDAFSSCKPDLFEATYEKEEEQE